MPTITGDRKCCASSLIIAFEQSGARSGWKTAWPDRTTRRGSNNCPVVRVSPVFKPVVTGPATGVYASPGFTEPCTWYAKGTTTHFAWESVCPDEEEGRRQPTEPGEMAINVLRVRDNACDGTELVNVGGGTYWAIGNTGWFRSEVDSNTVGGWHLIDSTSACDGKRMAEEVLSEPIHLGGPNFWNNVCIGGVAGAWVTPPEISVDLTLSDWGRDLVSQEWLAYDAVGCIDNSPMGQRQDSRLAFKITVDAPACALAGRMGKVSLVLRVVYLAGGVKLVDAGWQGKVPQFTGSQTMETVTLPAVEVDLDTGGTYITHTLSFSPSAGQGVRLANWWG